MYISYLFRKYKKAHFHRIVHPIELYIHSGNRQASVRHSHMFRHSHPWHFGTVGCLKKKRNVTLFWDMLLANVTVGIYVLLKYWMKGKTWNKKYGIRNLVPVQTDTPCRKSTHFWLVRQLLSMRIFFSHALSRNPQWKKFSQPTIINLFPDQSEMSALPAECDREMDDRQGKHAQHCKHCLKYSSRNLLESRNL